MATWLCSYGGDEMVFLAPGRFSRENEEKILYIAGMDWENQVEADDPW